jgi:UDP-glucose 4-epimerase
MARIVVTGGAGFIGSNLVLRLEREGHEVVIYDNLSRGLSPLLEGRGEGSWLVTGDILDYPRLAEELEGSDFVFHNAAMRSIPLSRKEPLRTSNANIIGTLNVLEAARQKGVRKVILASSSSVYGDNPLPFREGMEQRPLSLYAAAKSANESHARLYHRIYGLETVCLRYFNVFGYGQDGEYEFSPVIPRFIHALTHGRRPVIFGDGEQSRDFTFIDNVVEANLLAMRAGREASGLAFNVAQGKGHSLNQIVAMLNRMLGTSLAPIYTEAREGDLERTEADLSRSEKILGYSPKASFEEGLAATVEWYKKKL